jgi:hypothetical protein
MPIESLMAISATEFRATIAPPERVTAGLKPLREHFEAEKRRRLLKHRGTEFTEKEEFKLTGQFMTSG